MNYLWNVVNPYFKECQLANVSIVSIVSIVAKVAKVAKLAFGVLSIR